MSSFDASVAGEGCPSVAETVASMVNHEDVAEIHGIQQRMFVLIFLISGSQFGRLQRFEKTNEKLARFNELSSVKLAASLAQFKRHTQLIIEARKDLHSIFRRIR